MENRRRVEKNEFGHKHTVKKISKKSLLPYIFVVFLYFLHFHVSQLPLQKLSKFRLRGELFAIRTTSLSPLVCHKIKQKFVVVLTFVVTIVYKSKPHKNLILPKRSSHDYMHQK